MVFGEIVEPSTRALIIDEEEEYTDYPLDYLFPLEWEGTTVIPEIINSITFVETSAILKLLKNISLQSYASIKSAGVGVYVLKNNDYLVVCNLPEGVIHGEIVANFKSWLEKARNVYCVMSKPLALYVNHNSARNAETVIKSLTYLSTNQFNYSKLESPNLATGIAAAVMSYCIFKNKPCDLFIAYISAAPLDSVTAKPIIDLLRQLNVCKDLKLSADVSSSNLYM